MISKVQVMTLEYRRDRQQVMRAACALVNIPYEKLEFVFARCLNNKLPKTTSEMGVLMAADGLSEFGDFYQNNETWKDLTWLAADWTKMWMLQQIANQEENILMLSDTNYPYNFDFLEMEEQIGNLPDFKGLILQMHLRPEQTFEALELTERKTNVREIYRIFCGICAPAIVFTPEGADRYLEGWLENPNLSFYDVPFKVGEDNMRGFYACYPDKVRNVKSHTGYSFAKSDKKSWYGGFYNPPLWVPAGTGGL